MSIELLGNVTPILMIGESHSLAFKNILFRPLWSTENFICRTSFIPALVASEFSVGGSGINPLLADGLKAEGLLDVHLRPSFLYMDPSAAYIAGAPVIAPPLVFFSGDTEMVGLIKMLGQTYDFELPDDPGYGVDRSKQPIPYAAIHAQVAKIIDPFMRAVALLHAHQFSRTMVHCIPPRNISDKKAAVFTGDETTPASVRSKLVIVANRLIASACAQSGLGYIDIWPETIDAAGYLRPEFELDGIHVNRKAALISLDKIAAHLYDRTVGSWNTGRYVQLDAQAEVHAGGEEGQWAAHGFAAAHLDVSELAFSYVPADANALARTDWTGWPRSGRAQTAMAEPSDAVLEKVHALLASAHAVLHAGAARELTVASFRPVHVQDTDVLLSAQVPPGTRRAVLQLSDEGRIGLETLAGEAVATASRAGTLVVYDPARLRYRANGANVAEMVLLPRLPDQPFRVVWAGLCEWPADPYQFSVAGMKAVPAFKADSFSYRAARL
ncbi:MAG: hypothetical protein V4463_13830 [Pseudomonadota bacterium]